jgi:hypothetical protein
MAAKAYGLHPNPVIVARRFNRLPTFTHTSLWAAKLPGLTWPAQLRFTLRRAEGRAE